MENADNRTKREALEKTSDMFPKNPEGITKKTISEKFNRDSAAWIIRGICVSFLFAALFTSLYAYFQSTADSYYDYSPVETEDNISWLYQNSYLLYRDLYNKTNQTNVNYMDLYLKELEEQILLERELLEENMEEADSEMSQTQDYLMGLEVLYNEASAYFEALEESFSVFNEHYDYLIRDTVTGETMTNLTESEIDLSDQHFYLSFIFDESGNAVIGSEMKGDDITYLRKYANEVCRNNVIQEILNSRMEGYKDADAYCQISRPVNCEVIYCIDQAAWERMNKENVRYYVDYEEFYPKIIRVYCGNSAYNAFINAGSGTVLCFFMILVFLGALFLPGAGRGKPWNQYRICRSYLEILVILANLAVAFAEVIIHMAWDVSSGSLMTNLSGNVLPAWLGDVPEKPIAYIVNFTVLTGYFFCIWYIGICLRAVRDKGIRVYVRERSLIYRIFPYLKGKILQVYYAAVHFDVTRNAKKIIRRIVLINAVILFIISSLWMGGIAVTVVYSILLYVLLRKYVSDLQKKYGILLNATNQIAEGNLNVAITEDLGVFEPFKPQIIRIQRGFRKAVEEETKSQRMKAELITNVSHDLKTPLTAIITYIGLLKEDTVTPEQRREYLDTLERKALRLKVLIEDLFEVSKANSQTMTLNIMDVDMVNLLKQVSFEMADKLSESDLDVRMNLPDEKVILALDSQKTYRIFENLFGNIAKYAMPGTRVYVDLTYDEERVIITLKNITADEITVSAEELTERFVRGDSSRNTEGSGLGLAIAKSFTELQGGRLFLEIDGDLFKVITIFPLAALSALTQNE